MLEYSSIAELCRGAEQAGSLISLISRAAEAAEMDQPDDVVHVL